MKTTNNRTGMKTCEKATLAAIGLIGLVIIVGGIGWTYPAVRPAYVATLSFVAWTIAAVASLVVGVWLAKVAWRFGCAMVRRHLWGSLIAAAVAAVGVTFIVMAKTGYEEEAQALAFAIVAIVAICGACYVFAEQEVARVTPPPAQLAVPTPRVMERTYRIVAAKCESCGAPLHGKASCSYCGRTAVIETVVEREILSMH